jgi:hypothetical protein
MIGRRGAKSALSVAYTTSLSSTDSTRGISNPPPPLKALPSTRKQTRCPHSFFLDDILGQVGWKNHHLSSIWGNGDKFGEPYIICILRSRICANAPRLGYVLDDRGIGVRFPAGTRDFSLLHSVQPDSGAHPAPRGVQSQRREAEHSPPSSANMSSWNSAQLIMHRVNLILFFTFPLNTLSLWCCTVHKMWGLKYSVTHSVD